jgi:hypothetical protein
MPLPCLQEKVAQRTPFATQSRLPLLLRKCLPWSVMIGVSQQGLFAPIWHTQTLQGHGAVMRMIGQGPTGEDVRKVDGRELLSRQWDSCLSLGKATQRSEQLSESTEMDRHTSIVVPAM